MRHNNNKTGIVSQRLSNRFLISENDHKQQTTSVPYDKKSEIRFWIFFYLFFFLLPIVNTQHAMGDNLDIAKDHPVLGIIIYLYYLSGRTYSICKHIHICEIIIRCKLNGTQRSLFNILFYKELKIKSGKCTHLFVIILNDLVHLIIFDVRLLWCLV